MALLKLYHNNPTVKSLSDFVNYYHITLTESYDVKALFDDNRKVIFEQLNIPEKRRLANENAIKVEELNENFLKADMVLPCPCYMYIDEKFVTYNLMVKHTNFQVSETSVIAFQNRKISECIKNTEYTLGDTGQIKLNPGCRVIGWFKTQYYNGKQNNKSINNVYDSQNLFTDLSSFVVNLSTSVSENGGNFNITFPHIPMYSNHFDVSSYAIKGGENANRYFDKDTLEKYQTKDGKEFAIRSEMSSLDYFSWLIQPNDLIFLAFDDIETNEDISTPAKQSWDMIALVDSVSINRNSNAEMNINVSGRDLMKLITDDASIFFPKGVSNGEKTIFDNTESVIQSGDVESLLFHNSNDNTQTMRQLTGLLNIFTQEPNDFSIDFVLKTIVSHLTNYQVTPNDLFSEWGEERTKFSTIRPQ